MNPKNYETHLNGIIQDFQYLSSKMHHKMSSISRPNRSKDKITAAKEFVEANTTYIKNVIALVESIKNNSGNQSPQLDEAIRKFEDCLQSNALPNGDEKKNGAIADQKPEPPNRLNLSLNHVSVDDSEETVDEEIPFFLLPVPRTNVVLTGIQTVN